MLYLRRRRHLRDDTLVSQSTSMGREIHGSVKEVSQAEDGSSAERMMGGYMRTHLGIVAPR